MSLPTLVGDPGPFVARSRAARRVLLVDLNNFSRFPTLPVGLLTAVLRQRGHQVDVLSPFATGMQGVPRGARAKPWSLVDERLRWWSATTNQPLVRALRQSLERLRRPDAAGRSRALWAEFEQRLAHKPEVVFVSAYLMYRDLVGQMALACASARVPLVVGGPAFYAEETRRAWSSMPGLSGIFAGEAELTIETLLAALARGESAAGIAGFSPTGAADGGIAPPLLELDRLPPPDYSDFPWERYPNRIASILTARGCGWGVCKFCSDVVTVNGRGFRTRSLEHVLAEMEHLHKTYGVRLFCFADLKLNSALGLWRGLARGIQRAVPGAQWTCSVHVGPRADEGLHEGDLEAASRGGLVRITTGLESASQALLDSMAKGTRPADLARFLEAAKRAQVSTRLTAFSGYPGESAQDLASTAEFLDRCGSSIDRVHFSRFLIQSDTPIDRALRDGLAERQGVDNLERLPAQALVRHTLRGAQASEYRRQVARVLASVHRINRRPLPERAREFEGAM